MKMVRTRDLNAEEETFLCSVKLKLFTQREWENQEEVGEEKQKGK